jgi:hypothetical protein
MAMADAAKGVRQLVLVHGRSAARQMVEPQDKSLVEIASEVLGDDSNRKGFSYSGLCLTSLPHRRLANEEPWERTVGPLTLIVEPGRIKLGDGPAKMMGVPYRRTPRPVAVRSSPSAKPAPARRPRSGRAAAGRRA